MARWKLDINGAARVLSISSDAVIKRLGRGTLESEGDDRGHVWVWLNIDELDDQPRSESSDEALISEKDERIEDLVEEVFRRLMRARAVVVFLVLAMPVLVAAEPSPVKNEASATSPWPDLWISAVVGALVGAGGTFLLREWADTHRARQERVGLLHLLLTEMRHNQAVLYSARHDVRFVEEGALHKAMAQTDLLQDSAWKDARVRLAQLLPSADFTPFASYYKDLQHIADNVRSTDRMLGPPREIVLNSMDIAERSRRDARKVLEQYLGGMAQDTYQAPSIDEGPPREDYED